MRHKKEEDKGILLKESEKIVNIQKNIPSKLRKILWKTQKNTLVPRGKACLWSIVNSGTMQFAIYNEGHFECNA